jgi:DNA primase
VAPPQPTPPIIINPPLDFELKDLDPKHPYLLNRGFTAETIEYFGLGYCSRGLMKGRVVIPLHDAEYNLVGYAGRLTDDKLVDEFNPKYKFPSVRERAGKALEFRSSHLVYNVNRLTLPVQDLIVVEGFPSVWWLHQHGYTNVVALMGSSCSNEQARIITSTVLPPTGIWILSDSDESGEHCAGTVFTHVAPSRWVRWVKLLQGQPTDCTVSDLEQLLWPL